MILSTNYTKGHELAEKFSGFPCAIGFVEREEVRENREERYLIERARNVNALRPALESIFAAEEFPADTANDVLLWRHDGWGKPFVKWRGTLANWADRRGLSDDFLRVSNTHDGAAHLVFAAYGANLAGIGIDIVHLPRLRRADKGRDYLLRFARQFMSEAEYVAYRKAADAEPDDALIIRTAAHFSLMEAASKACGTGLKIGFGMGKDFALPKRSIEIRQITPTVELVFTEEARNRIEAMGVVHSIAHWTTDGDYLISAAALLKNDSAQQTRKEICPCLLL